MEKASLKMESLRRCFLSSKIPSWQKARGPNPAPPSASRQPTSAATAGCCASHVPLAEIVLHVRKFFSSGLNASAAAAVATASATLWYKDASEICPLNDNTEQPPPWSEPNEDRRVGQWKSMPVAWNLSWISVLYHTKFERLVRGCIDTDFRNQIFVGKLLTRSSDSQRFCTPSIPKFL